MKYEISRLCMVGYTPIQLLKSVRLKCWCGFSFLSAFYLKSHIYEIKLILIGIFPFIQNKVLVNQLSKS